MNKPHLQLDGYKTDHKSQYPQGTEFVYSNLTARSSEYFKSPLGKLDKTVFFGLQGFVEEYLVKSWNEGFFNRPKEFVVAEYKRRMDSYLGEGAVDVSHIAALHDLGYLPIRIEALPEGSSVDIKVPYLTIVNTHPDFFWITNYLETVISNSLWKSITTATTAFEFRKILKKYVEITGANKDFMNWQLHDFSMRGMSSSEDAARCGAAHLAAGNFGTDTLPAIDYLEEYYNADVTKELVGGSVPATEHSVMCMGTESGEYETFKRLITEVYPTGVVSIVSDTWDYWNVLTVTAPALKQEIMSRQPNAIGLSKVVFRPDSGDPVKIICGDSEAPVGSPEYKGSVEVLWDTFGGTVNDKGFKTLDQHVGLIYGDSITLDRLDQILNGLKDKGFAADNVVFGVGSYTYQYVTRDTLGMAMKATYGVVNGTPRNIAKNPKTGSGKKSACGLLNVVGTNGNYSLEDNQQASNTSGNMMTVFEDGVVLNKTSLFDIRELVNSQLK